MHYFAVIRIVRDYSMISTLRGTLISKTDTYALINMHGFGIQVFMAPLGLEALKAPGEEITLFTHLYWREETGPELYGFLSIKEREVFQKLNSISGIGPKSALAVFKVANVDQIIAAINEGKTDLLTRASGIGKKTAERIVLELKGKLETQAKGGEMLSLMESDIELEETLISLGYNRNDAKRAIAKIDPAVKGFKDRLRAALKK